MPKTFNGQYWEEPEVVSWLLSLANDMRRVNNDETLDDLPESIPQNAEHCIIANAFNYGCSVEPDARTITFQNSTDRNNYLNVMGFTYRKPEKADWVEDGYWEDEIPDDPDWIYVEDYGLYYNCDAPMTDDLVAIAEGFDNGDFKKYSVTAQEVMA